MKIFKSQINSHRLSFNFFLLPLLILFLTACGGAGGSGAGATNNNGPWLGNWIQVG